MASICVPGLGVVGVGVEADPVLAEVDPEDLLAEEGLADVRAEAAHAGDRADLLADAVVVRAVSASEVPGTPTQCIRKSRSLKAGNRHWPSAGPPRGPEHGDRRPRRTPGVGRTTIRPQRGGVAALQPADDRRRACARSGPCAAGSRHSAGVSVRATAIEATIASV